LEVVDGARNAAASRSGAKTARFAVERLVLSSSQWRALGYAPTSMYGSGGGSRRRV
jgi:hypothetical protein